MSEAGQTSCCGYDDIHKCFPPGLIRDMFIHGGIAAGVGGSIHLIMLREALDRARAAEARLDEERKLLDREREQVNKERERANKAVERGDCLREELDALRRGMNATETTTDNDC